MAQLDVQPKKQPNLWWLWLLLALAAIAILIYLLRGCNNKTASDTVSDTTTTRNTVVDTTSSTPAGQAIAATEPDWNSIDFNASASSDSDITDKDISVRGNDRYTIYTLGENILFATGQNTLQGTASQKLKQVAASLNKRYKGASIGVFGNTDSTGDASKNKELGAERAQAVKSWLISSGGVESDKVSVRTYGESKPVASNATESGRKQNRNVQIVAFTNNSGTK